ncbi:MAG: hypothetical protein LBG48_03740, partial [Rickettsiales bacterium]|nr:hypothetical protein [Rickettsiales bacterium]
ENAEQGKVKEKKKRSKLNYVFGIIGLFIAAFFMFSDYEKASTPTKEQREEQVNKDTIQIVSEILAKSGISARCTRVEMRDKISADD